MALEEKRAWIMMLTAVVSYAVYLAVVLGRAVDATPLTDVSYVPPLLWAVGVSIAASIVLGIVVSIAAPRSDGRRDQRDREIGRFAEHIGLSSAAVGGVAALVMAMAETDHFWIANVIYLGFTLSQIVSCVAKVGFYRWGFQPW
ncbi:hypothetical protein [Streptomyces poriticola]|uniref:hypothetical protein n=1 Tax=Streptomyces poriticola TaxID=3120506 RepID=UPI002FCE55A0